MKKVSNERFIFFTYLTGNQAAPKELVIVSQKESMKICGQFNTT